MKGTAKYFKNLGYGKPSIFGGVVPLAFLKKKNKHMVHAMEKYFHGIPFPFFISKNVSEIPILKLV